MKSRQIIIVLVAINLMSLAFVFSQAKSHAADAKAPVLRVSGLELVDEHGKVRAELKVLPAQPNFKMADGTVGYPEAVQLRLFTSQGAPNVKLAAIEDGSGLVLSGEKGYVQILSRSKDDPFVKIVTKDGREKVFKP